MFILHRRPMLQGSCNWSLLLGGGCPECLNNFIFGFVFCKWCLMGQWNRCWDMGPCFTSPVGCSLSAALPPQWGSLSTILHPGTLQHGTTCQHLPALGRGGAERKVCSRHTHISGSWKMAEPWSLPPRLEWHGSLGRWLARWVFWCGAGSCEGLY